MRTNATLVLAITSLTLAWTHPGNLAILVSIASICIAACTFATR